MYLRGCETESSHAFETPRVTGKILLTHQPATSTLWSEYHANTIIEKCDAQPQHTLEPMARQNLLKRPPLSLLEFEDIDDEELSTIS